MNHDRLREALAFGREQRGVEFKGPGARSDKHHLAKVVKSILGMANRADGGAVVIGVDDDGTSLIPTGLTPAELDSWGYDAFAEAVASYADPFVTFDVRAVELDSKGFIWVQVTEFELTPIICKKGYNKDKDTVLRKGAIYVRGNGKIETVEVPSHVEMREILDRAAEKRARELLQQVYRLGLVPEPPTPPTPRTRYLEEFDSSAASATIDKAKSRGHWIVRVFPQDFDPERIAKLSAVDEAIRRASVTMRGWDFPHYSTREEPARGVNWTGQEVDWEDYVEAWRAFKSGQFTFIGNIRTEWREQEPVLPGEGLRASARVLSVEDAVFKLTEIMEFAARLAATDLGAENLFVEVELHGLTDRSLRLSPRRAGFFRPQTSRADEWSYRKALVRPFLVANARDLAIEPAIQLFELFNWDVDENSIRSFQAELGRA